MNVYGNTCPMCCGDLGEGEVAYPGAGVTGCLSCGYKSEALVSAPIATRPLDAMAFNASAIAMRDAAMVTSIVSPDVAAA